MELANDKHLRTISGYSEALSEQGVSGHAESQAEDEYIVMKCSQPPYCSGLSLELYIRQFCFTLLES